ncbi:fungal specific transcription factor [Hirsutella rhossiliensis]|uniref:Fungal specific transcription factor domain-containing protein n=1 Tax=Hirsutella rhossiliensis TaxID=111463 RepID=A0A9P8MZ55_9HYPO|nr:fungal specific transcription factor domain-containing protein [Hirsutella rhossiliensis]KAH0961782.1 fungal specific transcription factor domain-containing protein [Hirsutella rhossiliensis]
MCRRRKLRCDRHHPCSTCSSRGLTCAYVETHPPSSWRRPTDAAPSVHDRLVLLESLVVSLVGSDSKPGASPIGDSAAADRGSLAGDHVQVPSECGSIRVSDSELRYVGGEHWAAILDSITDLKHHLDREEQLQLAGNWDHVMSDNESGLGGADCPSPHALLLYGCRRRASRYFNNLEMASLGIVHGPSFLREYETLLANPSGVPIAWIGLLFSVICLAVVTSGTNDPSQSYELEQQSLQINLYREKIVQCLIASVYTKSGPHVMETMLHHLHIEFVIRADADKDTWFLLALVVNLAMRMGYHRDPSLFKSPAASVTDSPQVIMARLFISHLLYKGQILLHRRS